MTNKAVNKRNVFLASLGTIAITLTGGLLATVFSPVFSPMSEYIKNAVSGNPITVITSAMTFDSFNKSVSKVVSSGDTISSNSITFHFTSYTNQRNIVDDSKPHYDPKYECSIDGNEYEPCVSPKSYYNLNSESGHSFHVRSSGILGNVDTEPDNFNFTVITSATVEGIVKNDSKPMSNVKYLIDNKPNPSGTVLDSKGNFRIEGIGQGNHLLYVFSKSNEQGYSLSFYVPGGQQEVIKLSFDIQEMSPSSIPSVIMINTSKANNTAHVSTNQNLTSTTVLDNLNIEGTIHSENNLDTNIVDEGIDFFEDEYFAANETMTAPTDIESVPKSNTTKSHADESELNLGQNSIKIDNHENPFSTRIWINATESVLSTIDRVDYYLHPTFTPNIVTSSMKDNQFEISFTNWGFFNLNAKVYFKDSSIKDLLLSRENWKM